MQIELIS